MRCGLFSRWREWTTIGSLLAAFGGVGSGHAATLRVPAGVAGVQAAIDLAQAGDTVVIDRGTYAGGLVISGKAITLASRYIETGDSADISHTLISGGSTILTIQATAGPTTTIRGLTFLNGSYQIENYARRVNILDDHFIGGGADQMSFEGAGGLVKGCLFERAGDDAIDCDDASDPIIEDNTILNPGDDGIELRLHPYTGSLLQIVFRDNLFSGCTEDGIQLIDYAGMSSRDFLIQGNVFANNLKAGLACMADGNTIENYLGAALVEPVRVIGNTFVGNPYGVTGGDNMLLLNNIIYGSTQVGAKRLATSSLASHNDLCDNAANYVNANIDAASVMTGNPRLGSDYALEGGSPCIDAGAISLLWNGKRVSAGDYLGLAPDLGARESAGGLLVAVGPPAAPAGMALAAVRPNPASGAVAISFTLAEGAPARLEIIDLAGRRILVRELGSLDRGSHVVRLPEARALATGVYLVRLIQGDRAVSTPMVLAR